MNCLTRSVRTAQMAATRAALLLSGVIICQGSVANGAAVGGWDLSRGGQYSVAEGSKVATIRNSLLALFPGTSLTGSPTLTPEYLSTLDAIILTSASSDFSAVSPLSLAEQSALRNFVLSGHRALILGERSDFSAATNATLVDPFALHISGTAMGHLPASPVNPLSNPIMNGHFGVVGSLNTINPGWFDTPLSGAQDLAHLNFNNQPILALIETGALGPGSGSVIVSADSDLYTQNLLLVVNTFSYLVAVPEPDTWVLATMAISTLVGLRVVPARRAQRKHRG